MFVLNTQLGIFSEIEFKWFPTKKKQALLVDQIGQPIRGGTWTHVLILGKTQFNWGKLHFFHTVLVSMYYAAIIANLEKCGTFFCKFYIRDWPDHLLLHLWFYDHECRKNKTESAFQSGTTSVILLMRLIK